MERKNSKGKKTAGMVLGTVVVAVAFIAGPSLLASGDEGKAEMASAEAAVFSVRTEEAGKRTLRAILEVNGDIVSAQEADVFPDVSGKLVRMYVALGSQVRKGDVMAEVDPSRPGTTYMSSPVYAPISGTVSKMPLSVGSTVGQNTGIAAISVTSNLEITARIPEREIAGLRTGLKAEVSLQAYPGEVFTATVNHVSPVLDASSRTKLITLVFDSDDSRINAGMFARIRINTRTYDEALAVSSEAVVNKHGENRVYVLRNNAAGLPYAEPRAVETGVTIDGWTEIRSGIGEGEAVLVQGQQLLSGGEAVRVVAGAGGGR
ncbi:MAG: efflux RND transporter periplasmic adaptor subunit [Spirochaetaceae bacterium]|jgi:multidrug efflux pump subunit AcrA (membrane-fusion protein)|nr:efflux RND transporter periplasmic adaptor subunit [Spirochaetaceae bacterium]